MNDNLPARLTRFVGRERDLETIGRLLDGERLVTLVGPGGCGKTRIAVELASRRQAPYPDGVWFVDLSTITGPDLVAATIAATVGLAPRVVPDAAGLARHLADRRALLVLDNCEHLVEEVASVLAELSRQSPELRVLATSREPVGVEGESVCRVGPLPPAEAARLFLDRARHADAAFEPSGTDGPLIDAICKRLDGMPLAIELAAACVGSMSPAAIADRLDARFSLLVGARSAIPRHRTLREAVEWSQALLTEPERRLFRRLAVFVGGFDVAAAEAVTADADLPVADVLPQLRRLVERSLVAWSRTGDGERYSLLETLREFASERLAAAGETAALRAAHAAHFTEVARPLYTAYFEGTGPDPADLQREVANFRAALEFAAADDPARLADLAGLLTPLWRSHLHTAEGRGWMELALPAAPTDSLERHRLAICLSFLARIQGDLEAAAGYSREALANRERAGDAVAMSGALTSLVAIASMAGDHAGAARGGETAIALARSTGDPLRVTLALNHTAMALMGTGELDRALALAGEAVAIARAGGLAANRLATYLTTLAGVHLRRGELSAAMALQREALTISLDVWQVMGSLSQNAALLIAAGRHERGVRLAGAADGVAERYGLDRAQVWGIERDWLLRGRQALGARAAAVWESGRRMSLEEARAEALDDAEPQPEGVRLSAREIEVARLVRQGLSNRRIAERLFISERTAEGHVANLLNKLNVGTRAEVAAWAAQHLEVLV